MNRKERRAFASKVKNKGQETVEDQKKALQERYTRLAAAAGDTVYRIEILKQQLSSLQSEMQDAQLQHSSLEKPNADKDTQAEANAISPEQQQEMAKALNLTGENDVRTEPAQNPFAEASPAAPDAA